MRVKCGPAFLISLYRKVLINALQPADGILKPICPIPIPIPSFNPYIYHCSRRHYDPSFILSMTLKTDGTPPTCTLVDVFA